MGKLNWNNLTQDERRRYMQIQMSPHGGYDHTGYLPEDRGECGVCGQPILGYGWCESCVNEFRILSNKLKGVSRA
jgi:hypothetical protein